MSLRRYELRYVEVFAGLVRVSRAPRRAGLVETRGHAAVGQPHVAQYALGVVAQRHRKLAQLAREVGSLAQHLARDDMRLADDLARVGARLRADLLGLLLRPATALLEASLGLLAPVAEQALGLPLGLGQRAAASARACESVSSAS